MSSQQPNGIGLFVRHREAERHLARLVRRMDRCPMLQQRRHDGGFIIHGSLHQRRVFTRLTQPRIRINPVLEQPGQHAPVEPAGVEDEERLI